MIKKLLIITGCLVILELLTMLGLALFSLGDAPPSKTDAMVGGFFCAMLKYVFGFPMVLFNRDAPFFLNVSMPLGIFLVLVNNCILSSLIIATTGRLKKLRKFSN